MVQSDRFVADSPCRSHSALNSRVTFSRRLRHLAQRQVTLHMGQKSRVSFPSMAVLVVNPGRVC